MKRLAKDATTPPIGAHAFIWSSQWDREGARLAATHAAAAGFDFIEIPLLDPSIIDTGHTVALLESLEISCTCSLGLPATCHLPAAPERAREFLVEAIDVAAELGSPWLTGAVYGNLGTLTGVPPSSEELDLIARTLGEVAAYAEDHDIRLGLEMINRYETYILNTVDQAVAMIDRIGAPNIYAHLDTFHANIEEASYASAISRLGHRLGYVHLAESHRGAIGTGHVPFDEVFDALRRLDYTGPLVVETFLNADPAIRGATATWRDHGLDPQQFAVTSLEYIAALRGPQST